MLGLDSNHHLLAHAAREVRTGSSFKITAEERWEHGRQRADPLQRMHGHPPTSQVVMEIEEEPAMKKAGVGKESLVQS